MKRLYAGPFADDVQRYGGNVSGSFAAYFVIRILTLEWRRGRLLAAGAALLAASLFEVTDGFGVMTNVYDPADLAGNAVGVALALGVDALTAPGKRRRPADAAHAGP